jgi:PAS domain S-box-containing protein
MALVDAGVTNAGSAIVLNEAGNAVRDTIHRTACASRLSADDKAALREFWRFYEPRRASISERVLAAASRLPEWANVLASLSPDETWRQEQESYNLQKEALLADQWDPYIASLQAQGEHYAESGVSHSAWFDLIRAYRDEIREQLEDLLKEDPQRNVTSVLVIARGMNQLLDIVVERIGEAYLAAKERRLARSESKYRAMFEQSPLPMWMFDRETLRFVMVNGAAMAHYGYSREEFLSMTLADIRPGEDIAALRADVQHAVGMSVGRMWRHRKKDGTTISVEIRANDFEMDGRSVRLVLITDVSARVEAEQALRKTEDQLRHAQKMEAIGRLAGGVAHDFNNLLTIVHSYACMLEENIEVADPRREDAAEIRRASERASGITRQLLTLSRHSLVAPRSLDLDDVVANFVPMLRRLLGENISIVTHRGNLPKVVADPGQLEQVLMNLAANARDAMPGGGRLTIESRVLDLNEETATVRDQRPGRYVELAVTDTGTGMDAETQSRIFDPFFTTKEIGKGTGLGLAIVHGIVSQAGGSISVYSEPNHGTTFRVQLPVTEATVTVDLQETVVAPRTLPAIRVLVVEDHPDVRNVATRILQDAGCSVIEAATADEARRICVSHEEPIDLVLLDVVLPDARGDVLVRQLRDLRPTLKVVQMSGYPAGALTPSGAFPEQLLTKPFSPAELRAAVARACKISGEIRAQSSLDTTDANASRRRLLLADDDDALRRVVARMLRKATFDVTEVDSGFKAISALESQPFDVVVSDVNMPDGGGMDLLRAVRRVDLDVPVILMTGEPSLAAAAQAVEYGAFRFLTKPLDSAAFMRTVEHAARAHALARLRREAFNASGAHAGVADRAGLEVRFEQAIDGMWMAFQPIVHARTGVLFGVEALMRTTEPSIPTPPALLDAATQLGRLPLVGRKVRSLSGTAITQRKDDISLFVNLHPDDLHDVDLIDEASPLSRVASRVILEVTERASLVTHKLAERVARLRQLGFRIAVDDIGAGYSGLTSFTELMPEVVKIDMSLVRDVHTSALKQRTIGALCRLCHEVGTLVVGEGVETLEEQDTLVHLGCDLLQGYLIGRPNRVLPA